MAASSSGAALGAGSHTERRTQLRSYLTAASRTIWTSWALARVRHAEDHHTP